MLVEAPPPSIKAVEHRPAGPAPAEPPVSQVVTRRGVSALGLWQWALLLALTVAISYLFTIWQVTSAMFLGPLVAGLLMAFAGSDLKISHKVTVGSQAVIGCMVALAIDMTIITFVGAHWQAIATVILATALSACIVAWGLVRFTDLTPQTAAWGSMPGAANIMVTLAADAGGDPRLVAFMQYVRLIVVLSTASAVASLLIGTGLHPSSSVPPAPAPTSTDVSLLDALPTMVMALVGLVIGRGLKIPAGPLLVTAVIGAVAHVNDLFPVVLPVWLLTIAKGAVGWYVGLQFDRAVLGSAMRNLPAMVLAMMALILLCAGGGMILSLMLGLDFVTGYLATSPGAIDTIAILAVGGDADMSVVMAIQTLRFFAVIVMAPYLVKLIVRLLPSQVRA